MDENVLPQSKITFHALCLMHNLDYDAFDSIATKACVSINVVGSMFVETAVERDDAEKVLDSLSQMIGDTRTLENTSVLLLDDEA